MSAIDNLMSSLASALALATADGKPLKYELGDKVVDNTGLVKALELAKKLQDDQIVVYYDSVDDEISVNGVDTTEYIDDV